MISGTILIVGLSSNDATPGLVGPGVGSDQIASYVSRLVARTETWLSLETKFAKAAGLT